MFKLIRFSQLQRAGLLLAALLAGPAAHAQLGYSGPPGATLMQQAKKKLAAGDRAGAAATYQQAYAAYMSVDDSDGMKAALAGQATAGAGAGQPARLAAAPARPAPPAAQPPAGLGGPAAGLLPGRTGGGKPVGLFFFVSSSDFNNQRVYYFTPTGQVFMDPTDFSAAGLAALPPTQRGSYAVAGTQMTIKWASGSTTTGNYHADASGFSCQGSFMCVAPFASPRQLVGTFDGHNAAQTVDANTLALFRTLALKADGTFTRDTYAAAHVESRHPDNTALVTDAASSGPAQAGHWKLDGWYLTLADARGTVRGVAFRTDWDEKTDKTLKFCFNGTSYKATN